MLYAEDHIGIIRVRCGGFVRDRGCAGALRVQVTGSTGGKSSGTRPAWSLLFKGYRFLPAHILTIPQSYHAEDRLHLSIQLTSQLGFPGLWSREVRKRRGGRNRSGQCDIYAPDPDE
jgi:hypothetical protein